jgi:phage shock protein PspC (stress-responsive transcriptional regulator)
MKKVINITIGNIVFLIEDDAYQKLESYLRDIRNHFSTEGDEIVDDIEGSIAEKFSAKGMDVNKAIKISDVEEIISLMGTVDELVGESGEVASEEKTTGSKRLYRDTDDVIIGGVASGIAKYFDIDPVITRVLFVIFGVFGGFGIPAYILFWIIVPPADTASKKIEMKGGRATISEIENFVKEKVDEIPEGKLKKFFSWPVLILKKVFKFTWEIIKRAGPVLSAIIGVSIALTALVSLFGFSIGYVALVSGGGNADPVISAVTGILATGAMGTATMISLYALLFIPLLMLVFFGILLVRRKQILGWIGATIMVVVWFVAANIVAATALTSLDEIRTGVDQAHADAKASYIQETYSDLEEFTSVDISNNVEVSFVKGGETEVVVSGGERALEALRVESEDGHLRIYRDHDFYVCIFYCSDLFSKTTITITTPSLEAVSFSGNVEGSMGQFEAESFSLRSTGNASFNLDVLAENVDVRVTGSGRIGLAGEADNLNMRLSGSAKIEGVDMEVVNASVRSSGSAKVNLAVAEVLDVRSSGSTKVTYVSLGEVMVTEKISGSGSVDEVEVD